jgi:hypothetical protein
MRKTALRSFRRLPINGSHEEVESAISSRPERRDRSSILLVHTARECARRSVRSCWTLVYVGLEATNSASGLRTGARSSPSAIVVGGELPEICRADFVEAI